jgi:hypothetical protein
MKKYILISLVIATSVIVVGCASKNSVSSSNPSNQISSSKSSDTSSKDFLEPLVLNDKTTYPSPFVVNGTSLIFSNWDDNNKLSIVNDPIPQNVILNKSVSDFYNNSAETFTIVNNNIYFGDGSNSNNLSSVNIADKTSTKLNNSNAHSITSSDNTIFYLDIPDNYNHQGKLYSYDITTKSSKVVTPDIVGRYIINNNFILYQNVSDGSKLYKIKSDGTQKEQLTKFSVDSFAPYSSQLLVVNSDDNNNLYSLDLSTDDPKRIAIMKITNLKVFNNTLYFISGDDANCLYKLNVDIKKPEATSTKLLADSINDFYPTDKGIFVQKGININNPYIVNPSATK